MSSAEPPPMKPEEEEDDDDLFRSAIDHSTRRKDVVPPIVAAAKDNQVNAAPSAAGQDASVAASSSGYDTNSEAARKDPLMERSDTLEDVKLLEDSPAKDVGRRSIDLDDDDDDDLFKSARQLEPEPEKRRAVGGAGGKGGKGDGFESILRSTSVELEDEDEHAFQSAILSPGLQLSGGHRTSNISTSAMNGSGHSGESSGESSGSPPPAASTSAAIPPPASGPGPTASEKARSSILDGMDNDERRSEAEANDEFIEIMVTEPHKVGDGMSSYVAYRVLTKTNANYFKRRDMSVVRRFSDFLGLHDKLAEKYLQNGRVIPPAPDKSVVGMTKIKIAGKEEETGGGAGGQERPGSPDEFLERRRCSLERYLNRTAAHPTLRTDPDFRDFLELDSGLPRANQTATLSGKNVMRLISKVGDKMTNLTLRMEETDQWFEEKTASIDLLDTQLRKLHGSAETLFDHRRALSVHTGQLARALAVLAGCEENSELSGALVQLSTVQERVGAVHLEQAGADFFQLAELVRDYIGLVAAVKDVFQERVKAWQQWQAASATLTKRREAKVRAELQQKPDKASALRQDIAEAERAQEMAQENFEKMSRLIKKEVELFDRQRCRDFKRNILQYLEAMLKAQEQISAHWERYLPEIQQINHQK